jgi:hypothetical protein
MLCTYPMKNNKKPISPYRCDSLNRGKGTIYVSLTFIHSNEFLYTQKYSAE